MDQLSEAFMCKKQFSVYSIFTLSLKFLLFLSYDALRICFLTHLVHTSPRTFGSEKINFFQWTIFFPNKNYVSFAAVSVSQH
jgi:hypothetical protein